MAFEDFKENEWYVFLTDYNRDLYLQVLEKGSDHLRVVIITLFPSEIETSKIKTNNIPKKRIEEPGRVWMEFRAMKNKDVKRLFDTLFNGGETV
jgi:hypothetical protein